MNLKQGLIELGLNEKESIVYIKLLDFGKSGVERISKTTGIHRRSVYDTLESLTNLGLVNHSFSNGTKVFNAISIDAFTAELREKQELINKIKPLAEEKINNTINEPEVEIFNGKKAMKALLEKMLQSNKTIYIYGGAMQIRQTLPNYYPKWTQLRKIKKIKLKGIFIDLPDVRKFMNTLPLSEYKFLPKKYLSQALWWVQDNKVFQVFFSDNPIIIVVKSKELAYTYLYTFNKMWSHAKK